MSSLNDRPTSSSTAPVRIFTATSLLKINAVRQGHRSAFQSLIPAKDRSIFRGSKFAKRTTSGCIALRAKPHSQIAIQYSASGTRSSITPLHAAPPNLDQMVSLPQSTLGRSPHFNNFWFHFARSYKRPHIPTICAILTPSRLLLMRCRPLFLAPATFPEEYFAFREERKQTQPDYGFVHFYHYVLRQSSVHFMT
ncbi:hypothetical protein K438DRAFT_1781254 [Mycena galopus ATCC 62051]|nr:hypothetical protein K438DRAFT_1781254 [Mycena galopus ATCC 62051]